jgi:hypothetical protein
MRRHIEEVEMGAHELCPVIKEGDSSLRVLQFYSFDLHIFGWDKGLSLLYDGHVG